MKLSEAIRLGSLLRPQKLDGTVTVVEGSPPGVVESWDHVTHTCALAAALQAVGATWRLCEKPEPGVRGVPQKGESVCDVPEEWQFYTVCPVDHQDVEWLRCWNWANPVGSVLAHLNDHHKWTREKIADWVSDIEDTAQSYVGLRKAQEAATAATPSAPDAS